MNYRPTPELHRDDLEKVLRVLDETPTIDCEYTAPVEEFQSRVRRINQALQQHGHVVGLVFSDEHYAGDVPYLGGNTNISIEQVAGVVGPSGFHVVAGLEGGYVAEQRFVTFRLMYWWTWSGSNLQAINEICKLLILRCQELQEFQHSPPTLYKLCTREHARHAADGRTSQKTARHGAAKLVER